MPPPPQVNLQSPVYLGSIHNALPAITNTLVQRWLNVLPMLVVRASHQRLIISDVSLYQGLALYLFRRIRDLIQSRRSMKDESITSLPFQGRVYSDRHDKNNHPKSKVFTRQRIEACTFI